MIRLSKFVKYHGHESSTGKILQRKRCYDTPNFNANLMPKEHRETTLKLYKKLYRNCHWAGKKDPGTSRLIRLEFERFRWQEDQIQIEKLHRIGNRYLHPIYKMARNAITQERTWQRLYSVRLPDGTKKSPEKLAQEEAGRNLKWTFKSFAEEQVLGIAPRPKTSFKKSRWIDRDKIEDNSGQNENILPVGEISQIRLEAKMRDQKKEQDLLLDQPKKNKS